MTDREPPYPGDTRARGWDFDLKYEQIEQSDTWALAASVGQEGRPLLLMQWFVSWRQVPCGSLPNDEAVIAALMGINAKLWAKYRAVLMRNWRLASDGRLYHETITKRVLEMLSKRRKDADRSAKLREKRHAKDTPESPPDHTEVTRDTPVSSTPTKTKTEYKVDVLSSEQRARETDTTGFTPTPSGLVGQALKRAGVSPASFSLPDPRVTALLDQFEAMGREAVERRISRPLAWICTTLAGRREDAARISRGPPARGSSGSSRKQTQLVTAALMTGTHANHPEPETLDADDFASATPRRLG
jgi:uncharacterized protein YdaU (DUF1376 family)